MPKDEALPPKSRRESVMSSPGSPKPIVSAPSAAPSPRKGPGESALGRLGRGLGNLIPVAIPRSSAAVAAAPSPPPNPRADVSPTGPATSSPATSVHSTENSSVGRHVGPGPAVAARVEVKAAPSTPVAASGSASTRSSVVSAGPILPKETSDLDAQRIQLVSLTQVTPNRLQPRVAFSEETIRELASSIEQAGLIQPIVVRPTGNGQFELIAGERRLRAARYLKWTTIPALVRPITDEESGYWSLIENVQREELNPMERAEGMDRLRTRFNVTQAVLAEKLGMDRATVANLLRLTDLDPPTADLVRKGSLSLGHAKVLLGVEVDAARARLAKRAVGEGWSVRQLELEVKAASPATDTSLPRTAGSRLPPTKSISAHIAHLERELGDHLGTRVNIRLGRKAGSGKIVIEFFSLDQFDGLTDRMGYRSGS